MYKLIHKSSAVSSKCSPVLVFMTIVLNNNKKKNTIVLKSPKNKVYFRRLNYCAEVRTEFFSEQSSGYWTV